MSNATIEYNFKRGGFHFTEMGQEQNIQYHENDFRGCVVAAKLSYLGEDPLVALSAIDALEYNATN